MAVTSVPSPRAGLFLLELLHYSGWQLEVRETEIVRIHATRDGVEIDAAGRSFPEAAQTAFARAMRSGRHGRPPAS